ncbi:unnamed protein product [Closterium sp. NIES-54]
MARRKVIQSCWRDANSLAARTFPSRCESASAARPAAAKTEQILQLPPSSHAPAALPRDPQRVSIVRAGSLLGRRGTPFAVAVPVSSLHLSSGFPTLPSGSSAKSHVSRLSVAAQGKECSAVVPVASCAARAGGCRALSSLGGGNGWQQMPAHVAETSEAGEVSESAGCGPIAEDALAVDAAAAAATAPEAITATEASLLATAVPEATVESREAAEAAAAAAAATTGMAMVASEAGRAAATASRAHRRAHRAAHNHFSLHDLLRCTPCPHFTHCHYNSH